MIEEKKLAELRERWPMMKNTHPRQKNSPDWNTWRDIDIGTFVRRMDKDLYNSWREFEREYNSLRIEELKNMYYKDERYAKDQPVAHKVIVSILEFKTPLHTYDEMVKRIRDIRKMFPIIYDPSYRGVEK